MKISEIRTYLDLEYCYPGMTQDSGRPTRTDLRQVVQIAAIKFDHNKHKEISSYNQLVKPAFMNELPEFFIDLTGITQTDIDSDAIPFDTALSKLVDFCAGTKIYTFDKDWEVLQQNCSYTNTHFPYTDNRFIRIKERLRHWNINKDGYSSGTLHLATASPIQGQVHNALHDVRSMAAATDFFDFRE